MVRASAIEIRIGRGCCVSSVEAGASAPAAEAIAIREVSDTFPRSRSGDGSGTPTGAGGALVNGSLGMQTLPDVQLHALNYP